MRYMDQVWIDSSDVLVSISLEDLKRVVHALDVQVEARRESGGLLTPVGQRFAAARDDALGVIQRAEADLGDTRIHEVRFD